MTIHSDIPADYDLFIRQANRVDRIIICEKHEPPFIDLHTGTFVVSWVFGDMMWYTVHMPDRSGCTVEILTRRIVFNEAGIGLDTFQDFVTAALSSSAQVLFI